MRSRVPMRVRRALDRRRRYELASYLAGASPLHTKSKLCILATGRTGTELLVDLLDDHPDIRCESEILRRPTASAWRLIRGREAIARLQGYDAYGFKAVVNQFHSIRPRGRVDLFLRRLDRAGYQLVHLKRRDLLRQAISHMRAEQMDEYHFRSGSGERLVITADIPDLFWKMRWIEHHEKVLTGLLAEIPHRALCYEDDLEQPDDRDRTIRELQAALGVEPRGVATGLRKIGGRTLADDVTNLDEIVDHLGRTRYSVYLPR